MYTFAAVKSDFSEDKRSILETAMGLFTRFGIKSVTMDEVARSMGMSKKTVYKHTGNKQELIDDCCIYTLGNVHKRMRQFQEEAENAIDELLLMDEFMREKVESQLHLMEHQLKRYFPRTHAALSERRHKMIIGFQQQNLNRGIEEGLYLDDIDVEVVSQLYFSKINGLLTQSTDRPAIPNLKQLLGQAMLYHIRGIATKKGITYLEDRMKQTPTES